MASRTDARPPWKRKNPKETTTRLTARERAEARARARAAGRRYPNLVDNMAVAQSRRRTKSNRGGKARRVKSSKSDK
jgi:hypothetical protein